MEAIFDTGDLMIFLSVLFVVDTVTDSLMKSLSEKFSSSRNSFLEHWIE